MGRYIYQTNEVVCKVFDSILKMDYAEKEIHKVDGQKQNSGETTCP